MDNKKFYDELIRLLNDKAKSQSVSQSELQKYFKPEGILLSENYLTRLSSSLQNSGMMHNSIRFNESDERRTTIKEALLDFDGKKALERYSEWQELYNALTNGGKLDEGLQKHLRDEKRNEERARKKGEKYVKKERKETNFEKYSKGLYDGLEFLYREGGNKLIDGLCEAPTDDYPLKKKIANLKAIQKRIHGLGFALTCDWIKECGAEWLAKPDVHIKTVIEALNGGKEPSDEKTVEMVYALAEEIGTTAYKLDKVIWLICTGNFYLSRDKINRDTILKLINES